MPSSGATAAPVGTAALRKRFAHTVEEMSNLSSHVEKRIQVLEEKEAAWQALEVRMQENAKTASDKIKLDVGGRIFATAKASLLRFEGSYFHAMLASGHWKPDSDGSYFIDLNPKHFDRVLDYLRTGEMSLDGLRPDQVKQLRKTLDYLQLSPDIEEPLRWDPQYCGSYIKLSEEKLVATNKSGNWHAVQSSTLRSRFTVRIITGSIMVGFAPRDRLRPTTQTYNSCGWYYYTNNGSLFAQGGISASAYPGASSVNVNDTVTAIVDRQSRTISFEVNGRSMGIAFTAIPSGELYPTVCISTGSVRLEDQY